MPKRVPFGVFTLTKTTSRPFSPNNKRSNLRRGEVAFGYGGYQIFALCRRTTLSGTFPRPLPFDLRDRQCVTSVVVGKRLCRSVEPRA